MPINLHPDRDALFTRLKSRAKDLASGFEGEVYRFVNPRFSSTSNLFAGNGSEFANGRWLMKGKIRCTYTSLLPETALAESLSASRYFGFPDSQSTPIILVTASVRLGQVLDLRNGKVRQRLRFSEKTILETDWRAENQFRQESLTQAWGWAIQAQKLEAIVAPSSASPESANLILFPGNFSRGSRVKVIKEVKWPRS